MTATVSVPWRSDEPRLTRDQAAATRFPVTAWTKRGYDPAAVDAFMVRVISELEMLATEKASFFAALQELRGRFKRGEDPGEWSVGTAEALEMAVSVRSEAQLAADRTMSDVQELAARTIADARAQRAALLDDAEQVRRDADAYAERVRAEADERARDAASAALDVPVGPDAERLVRAERARNASLGGGMDVYVENTLVLAQAMTRLLEDCRARIRENGHGPR